MIITLLRIPLTLLYAWYLYVLLSKNNEIAGGEIVMIMAYGLFGAIFMAILWAPVVGEKISDPLTATFTQDTSLPPEPNRMVRWIVQLQRRGHHRLALVLVFVEGVRHPTLPQPALLGLRSVKPGSFLEKCFAKEVYTYNNIQNCLHAYTILRDRHRTIPALHKHPEVNIAIMNLSRELPPERAKYEVKPSTPPQRPRRNPRIRLFRA